MARRNALDHWCMQENALEQCCKDSKGVLLQCLSWLGYQVLLDIIAVPFRECIEAVLQALKESGAFFTRPFCHAELWHAGNALGQCCKATQGLQLGSPAHCAEQRCR